MEKICIVRRRKDIRQIGGAASEAPLQEAFADRRLGLVPPKIPGNDPGAPEIQKKPAVESAANKKEIISFELTPEQCEFIKSGSFGQYMAAGTSKGAAIDVQQGEDGQISLNFYFDRINNLRLLKARDVCEMLQISKSCLGNLIRNKKLNSYKIGGTRRFSMEDIMEFLTGKEYFESTR